MNMRFVLALVLVTSMMARQALAARCPGHPSCSDYQPPKTETKPSKPKTETKPSTPEKVSKPSTPDKTNEKNDPPCHDSVGKPLPC